MSDEPGATEPDIAAAMAEARGGIRLGPYEWAATKDPDFMRAYEAFSSSVWNPDFERALEPKTRALIPIVLFAYRGLTDTLPRHIQRAKRLGATEREIMEALEAAVLPGGGPTFYRGLQALMEVDQMENGTDQVEPSSNAE